MFKISNFTNNTNNINILQEKGPFQIIEYKKDLSVNPTTATTEFFCNEMNVRKRQVICHISEKSPITLQTGAMQWTIGDVNATTGIKSASDLFKKSLKGMASGESTIKPEYKGKGLLITEPTYKHLLLIDVADWNGGIVLDDGLFLACESHLKQNIVARSNLSSAIAGGEGLFNLSIKGDHGIIVCESTSPHEELIEIELNNDVIKIDGNMAIAWSPSLEFTVERSGKTLIGSATSGEGLVNVYRGTGHILLSPVSN